MRLAMRITTWFRMFYHLMERLARGEVHIEVCETRGPELCGVYLGVVLIRRYCVTCGYLKGNL